MTDSIRLGDCLSVMAELPAESVDLVYLDPPFFTQKHHSLSDRAGTRHFKFEDIWRSCSDYAEFLFERLSEAKRVLKDLRINFFSLRPKFCSHSAHSSRSCLRRGRVPI